MVILQVMYVTATTPYIIMVILLIRGLTLDGAADGIKYYLYPDFKRLADLKVRQINEQDHRKVGF